jgi:RNA polymerase sigma factor (sigma-70 family)
MRMSLVGRNNLRLVPRDPGAAGPPRGAIMDDQALVAAAKAGNHAVASMLCDRLWPQVDRSIRRLVGASDIDRDDLSQLAMIELVSTIDRYRADCSLDSWTQAVTAHVVFKHLRRRRLERRVFSDLLIDDGAVGAPVHVERRSATREALARIAALLDEMNEGRAWAYVLHDLLGYDLREVAQITNSTVAATQSRLVRGRREVHERVGQDGTLSEVLTDPEVWR